MSMFLLILFQSPRKLIRAGSWTGAAVDSINPFDGFIDVHTFDQPGYALGVAGTAAYVLDVGDLVIFYIKMNFS